VNLAELRTLTRKLSGVRMSTVWSDTDLDRVLEEVHREVCAASDWPFLYTEQTVTLTSGDARVTLPTPLRTFQSVVDDGSPHRPRLRQLTLQELEVVPDRGQTGRPEVFAVVGDDKIEVWPRPNAAYPLAVTGFRVPASLALAGPAFANEFHPVLPYAAAAKLLMYEGDSSGRSEQYREEVVGYLSRMAAKHRRTHDTGLFQMGGRATRNRRWRMP
jgi:hypothetical protein